MYWPNHNNVCSGNQRTGTLFLFTHFPLHEQVSKPLCLKFLPYYKTKIIEHQYFSINSQVCPRNSEYLGVSEDSKRHNSKNVRVNAQVTAIITMLEFIGGCLFVIGWVF